MRLERLKLGRLWSGGCWQGFRPKEVQQLLQIARRRRFERNEVVFHADDPGDSMHLITKGRFSVRVMTPLGQVATIAVRGPGREFR